jgi:hypothetical protein
VSFVRSRVDSVAGTVLEGMLDATRRLETSAKQHSSGTNLSSSLRTRKQLCLGFEEKIWRMPLHVKPGVRLNQISPGLPMFPSLRFK